MISALLTRCHLVAFAYDVVLGPRKMTWNILRVYSKNRAVFFLAFQQKRSAVCGTGVFVETEIHDNIETHLMLTVAILDYS